MFPVRYGLGFYIPENGILHSHRSEHLKSYLYGQFSLYSELLSPGM
jgi:hypothetical protein